MSPLLDRVKNVLGSQSRRARGGQYHDRARTECITHISGTIQDKKLQNLILKGSL